ncbi:MAG: HAD-IA family hydrolase [Pseudomonadota bacterium]|nr:HAD-IA family hydrolase [Pseudomonadota bacterium]
MTHIFFDVDGVLINWFHANPAVRNRWDKYVKQDLGIDPEVMSTRFFGGPFLDVIVGRRDLVEALEEFMPQLGYHGPVQTFIDYWFQNDAVVNHSVLNVAKKLSKIDGVHLYIATNQEKYRAKYLWEAAGFKDHFKDIYYSGKLGVIKHDPTYFRKINQELGLTSDHTVLFFDDDPKNVAAAQNQGWKAFVFEKEEDLLENEFIRRILKPLQASGRGNLS